MAKTTNISWTDMTFNGWIGCTKVSVGPLGACVGCYAEAEAKRRGWAQWGDHPRHRTSVAYWRQPLTWNRKAAAAGDRPFVFCSSLADVFDNQISPAWRRDLFDLIRATPHLTWLLLTKRPQNIAKLFAETITPELRAAQPLERLGRSLWPTNAAIGCTVVTQEEADRDVPVLLAAKGALNPAFAFLSMEPLMGAVDLRQTIYRGPAGITMRGFLRDPTEPDDFHYWAPKVDWVIAGGETDQGGHKARPSNPQWFRDLRDQCQRTGTPFHFKQWGEWVSVSEVEGPQTGFYDFPDGRCVRRIGKGRAGRTLDGAVHDARPNLEWDGSGPKTPTTNNTKGL